jgi:predicted transcriptional regulator YheO
MAALSQYAVETLMWLKGREREENEANRAASMENITRANKVAFERACQDAGIDPAGGVSPYLIKALIEQGMFHVKQNNNELVCAAE